MNGILLVDKPQGFTSFDVVAKLRGIAQTRRVGHSGTLDPMATGVLPVFFGRAAKACDLLPNEDKAYRGVFQLGLETDTQDITGEVTARRPVTAAAQDVLDVLPKFSGDILQVPPMYSAVKVNGKRLYALAREGIEVERKPRPVTIHGISLVKADEERHIYTVDVACSKGTYIRTLCRDIGEELGCGACLTELRRTMACGFRAGDCITLEEAARLAGKGLLEQALIPVERIFSAFPRLDLDDRNARQFCNGVKLPLSELPLFDGDMVTVYHGRIFLGLGSPDRERVLLRKKKLFHLEGID